MINPAGKIPAGEIEPDDRFCASVLTVSPTITGKHQSMPGNPVSSKAELVFLQSRAEINYPHIAADHFANQQSTRKRAAGGVAASL